MGSLRFLSELPKEQINSLELTQKRLLLLRSLIVLLLAFLLAGLVFKKQDNNSLTTWVVVEAGLLQNPSFKNQLASYQSDSSQIFIVSDSLQEYSAEQNYSVSEQLEVDYAQLIAQLAYLQSAPDSLVVFTSGKLSNFSSIPQTSIPLKWIAVPDRKTEMREKIVAARYINQDSLLLTIAETKSDFTSYTYRKVPKQQNASAWEIKGDTLLISKGASFNIQPANLKVNLFDTDTNSRAVQYLKAGLNTLAKYSGVEISIKTTADFKINEPADFTFGIDGGFIPETLVYEKFCLVKSGFSSLNRSFYAKEKGIFHQLNLDTQAKRPDANIVNLLAQLLFKPVEQSDLRTIDEKQLAQFEEYNALENKVMDATSVASINKASLETDFNDIDFWILGLCLFLILIERTISSKP